MQVIVPSLLGGLLTVLDGGTISGNGIWAPSPRIKLLLCNVTGLLGTRAVAFRFTPVGRARPSRSTTSIWIPGKTAETCAVSRLRPWSDRCPWPSGLAAPSG